MTQPNPYPTEPPYIEQQLACRKKIGLSTSRHHHHHPNAHRNNANTHKFSQNEFVSRYSTQSYIYTRHVFFAHLPFQTHDPTQPTKNKFSTHSRPNPTQPSPTQPAGQPNPRTALRQPTISGCFGCISLTENDCLRYVCKPHCIARYMSISIAIVSSDYFPVVVCLLF